MHVLLQSLKLSTIILASTQLHILEFYNLRERYIVFRRPWNEASHTRTLCI